MKKLFIVVAAVGAIFVAVPASAENGMMHRDGMHHRGPMHSMNHMMHRRHHMMRHEHRMMRHHMRDHH